MPWAEPANLKWLGIVVMMLLRFLTANLARFPFQDPAFLMHLGVTTGIALVAFEISGFTKLPVALTVFGVTLQAGPLPTASRTAAYAADRVTEGESDGVVHPGCEVLQIFRKSIVSHDTTDT